MDLILMIKKKKKMYKATPRTTLEDLHKVLGPEFVKQGQVLRELEEEIISDIVEKMNKKRIYLDDVRTPVDPDWTVVRSYDEFVVKVTEIGLENIEIISLDHDLGPSAMAEWHSNVYHNYELNYDNIEEKTGMDCTKWLVNQWLDGAPYVQVNVHSANAVGASNMLGLIWNYCHIHRIPQNSVRWQVPHTV
jgi:hypothetical protein